ncbi:MAG: Rpn family recombination-promoting nuclease/putative transposase [Lachnospiraceae bacterium]|nr:Rpn family recombination-promoting nuclease/putative transposase [Lachnospiraceae bacterium]
MSNAKQISHEYAKRKLEDLNLIDDFLFQELISQKEDGEEFARILLSTILGKTVRKVKVIPQKNILGIDTDRHGIRMDAYIEDISAEYDTALVDAQIVSDIYDIEPNNKYEKESLPKRMRYYHGLIDTQLLASGLGYNKLQNVIIIIILPYDPFGINRMVYTIQNQCVEATALPYDDGAKKIFLYTKGTEGNPSQELKDMLKYIENTTQNNIANQNIESIHRMVERLKKNKEVGISYMKSWEREQLIRDEGRDEGRNEGQFRINQLNIKLIESGRMDDVVRSAKDRDYQQKLLEELNL